MTLKESILKKFIVFLGCFTSILTLLYAYFLFSAKSKFTATLLPLCIVVLLLNLYYTENKIKQHPIKEVVIWIVSLIMLTSSIYFWKEFYYLLHERLSSYNIVDYVFVTITIILVIYLCFKKMGKVFGTVVLSPFIIVAIGQYLPYPFAVSQMHISSFIAGISLDLGGIWGSVAQGMATYVGIFVIYAAIVKSFGGLESLIALFIKVLGRHEIFFPQIATTSSMFFGSFSGSALANVAGTGSFTIPLMKLRGMKSEDAASIETIASSGGSIMPPIMGAGAFLMADILGVGYVKIMLAAIFPAFLFYFNLFLNTHWIRLKQLKKEEKAKAKAEGEIDSSRYKDKEEADEQIEEIERTYFDGKLLAIILISMIVLVYLLIQGASILYTAIRTILIFYVLVFIKEIVSVFISSKNSPGNRIDMIKEKMINLLKTTINSLNDAANGLALMVVLGGGLGIVSTILLRTGLLNRMSVFLVGISRGNLVLLLFVTIVLCVLLGMAVSAVATYLLVVPIVVGAFTKLGMDPFTTHFIVFYASCLAPITPPMAPACALAAQIADADYVKTAKKSLMVGSHFVLLPVIFAKYPEILQENTSMFFILLGVLFLISFATFVEIKGTKKVLNVIIFLIGLFVIFNRLPDIILIIVSVIGYLLVIIGLKYKGVIPSLLTQAEKS